MMVWARAGFAANSAANCDRDRNGFATHEFLPFGFLQV
jgi:hypothetical protein